MSDPLVDQLLVGLGYTDARWLQVPCSGCGAETGHLCRSEMGRPTAPHSARYRSTIPTTPPPEVVVFGLSKKYHRQGCAVGPYGHTCSDPVPAAACEQLRMKPCMVCRPHEAVVKPPLTDPESRSARSYAGKGWMPE